MIITAQTLRYGNLTPTINPKTSEFNKIITDHLNNCPDVYHVNLYFDEWGYDYSDIQFISDAGYEVYRNGSCLWWEVSW